MTTQQPEALRLAELLELAPEDGIEPQTAEDAAAGLRRLHSENESLQAGYAAARLEIESLQARIKTMAEEHADELMVAHLDGMRAAQPAGAQQTGTAGLVGALEDAQRAINSMKVEAETAAQGDEQMMLEACETISNEGLQAGMAIRAALASHGQAPAQAAPVCGSPADLPPLPGPDLRDVGTTPGGIKEFLRGYATEYAKAALASSAPAEARRLFDAGWRAAALFCDREDVVADGITGFGACPQFEAAFSAAHGSTGGQHGTE